MRSALKEFLLAEYRLGYIVAHEDLICDTHNGLIESVGYDIGNPPAALNSFFDKIS